MSKVFAEMLELKKMGKCPLCEKDMSGVKPADFMDLNCWQEFNISGFCQACQNMELKYNRKGVGHGQ